METNMKHYLLALSIGTAFLVGCQSPQKQNLIDSNFAFAEQQLKYAFPKIDEARANESQESKEKRIAKQWGELTNPRNTEPDGSLRLVPSKDWTSGFFPGELWYVYEYTHDPFWKEKAEKHTEMLEREKKNGTTHDMGFKMYCSYGNGYRLTGNPTYKDILIESARTLITRYKPNVGCLRSWDHHADQWECPVIIDNMLNLELLFLASHETNDSTFYNIAVNHARTTMKNHFRDDYSTYHVVNYDTITGNPICKVTHQGYADSSAWARGQAWALYGYTMCYRETGLPEFLEQAKHIESEVLFQVVGKPLRGGPHRVDVHAVGAGADHAAQAAGAKGEVAVEGVLDGRLVHASQFLKKFLVGHTRQPALIFLPVIHGFSPSFRD